ncbi:helix-turn-helix domain-containing protein [Streptomyces sp. NPDC053431]|uniref:helix-turn-helix domain-containing protein n=1 Tax=Streptomyces sp. NPDC053431 TaxID=3365703 RepID=UPI0037D2ED8B
MTLGETPPDPREARNPAEFIARLQALKDWSGLTYRELSARAEALGDVLPRSTVANMLSRTTVPREELLGAFVRACGARTEEWEAVRKELAVHGAYEPEPGVAPEAGADTEAAPVWPGAVPEEPPAGPAPPPRRSRIRRALVGAVAATGLVLAGVSVVALVRDGDRRPHEQRRPPVLTAPAEGPVHIRVIGSGLCLNERRGSSSGQIYQRSCAGADVPRYELKRLAGEHWRIVSVHPDFPVGCSGIPSGGRIPAAALEDSECGDPTRVERFTLEPYGSPPTGWRIVPAGSATPGSCVTVVGDRGAEWSRLAQAPCTADARGQLFSFDRRDQGGSGK